MSGGMLGLPPAVAVAVGAAAGALLRWQAGAWFNPIWGGFPLGTLFVNLIGGLDTPSGGEIEIEGERIPVPVDDASLKKISQLGAPGGRFFTASSLEELNAVYSSLQEQIGYETTRGDDSHPWVLAGTILALLSAAGALLLNQRLP